MTGDKLIEIFDKAVAAISEDPSPEAQETEQVLVALFNDVLSLDEKEVESGVRAFFQEWYDRHWKLREVTNKADAESAPVPTHGEEVSQHVQSHYQDITKTDDIYKWLAGSAHKSIPPTIICYALVMYARDVYGYYTCVAEKLYGGELPEHDHGDSEDVGGES